MPDTQANQAAYPQSRNQKPGLGFPLCRILGIVCLGSGALLNAAISPYQGKGKRGAVVRAMKSLSPPGAKPKRRRGSNVRRAGGVAAHVTL